MLIYNTILLLWYFKSLALFQIFWNFIFLPGFTAAMFYLFGEGGLMTSLNSNMETTFLNVRKAFLKICPH